MHLTNFKDYIKLSNNPLFKCLFNACFIKAIKTDCFTQDSFLYLSL